MADEVEGTKEASALHSTQIGVDIKQGKRPDTSLVSFQAPGFIKQARFRLFNALLGAEDRIVQAATREIDTGSAFNLVPVFLGIGILAYFVAPVEPVLLVLVASFLCFAGIAWRLSRHGVFYYCCMVMAALFAGMTTMQLATMRTQAPQLERQLTAKVSGIVLAVDQNQRGSPRYLISPYRLGDLHADDMPLTIRASAASKHIVLQPGDNISGLVRLQPVSGPAYPGSYDFSFFAWFKQLGGSGFFMGAPERGGPGQPASLLEGAQIAINQIRISIEARIAAAITGEPGDIAIALVTGNRSRIPTKTRDSLRRAGLAHILAISGLHMALVTLTVIWLVRVLLAGFASIVLHYPVKKWATCAGFVTACAYLVLSGAGIATQRAWIMISVMLLAVIMDRRAITMRSVAVSAILILLVNPESLLSPGFQMSFAAVIALVAGYEAFNRRRGQKPGLFAVAARQNRLVGILSGSGKYFGGIAITSLIAGSATMMLAAWHFQQIAVLGLLGNLLAMPLIALLVMPLAMFSMLLMPYGFEQLTLQPMGIAIEMVVAISRWVEGISPPGEIGLLPVSVLMFFGLGLIILTLLKTWFRYIGLVMFAIIPLLVSRGEVPDILVSENGRVIAVKTTTGELALLYPRRNRFVSEIWLKAWPSRVAGVLNIDPANCDKERCIVKLVGGSILHVVYDPDLLHQSCKSADILIAPRLWWVNCRGGKPELILKRWNFEQYGTHALYLDETGKPGEHSKRAGRIRQIKIRVETALGKPVRPWQRRVNPVNSLSDIAGSIRSNTLVPSPGQN